MSEQLVLTPEEAQLQHQAAILSTLPAPKWKNIPSAKLFLYEYINDLEGAQPRILDMLDPWHPALVGALVVHEEGDDRYGTIDGRHRKLKRQHDPWMFHCAVFSGLSQEQIIALYLYHNRLRRNPSVEERYLAAAASGDPVALTVQSVLRTRGVTKETRALSACQAVVLRAEDLEDGKQTLDWTLRMLTTAFPATDKARLNSMLINAVSRVFRVHGANPKLRMDRLIEVLNDKGKMTASHLKAIGAVGGSSGEGAAARIFRHIEDRYAAYSGGHRL